MRILFELLSHPRINRLAQPKAIIPAHRLLRTILKVAAVPQSPVPLHSLTQLHAAQALSSLSNALFRRLRKITPPIRPHLTNRARHRRIRKLVLIPPTIAGRGDIDPLKMATKSRARVALIAFRKRINVYSVEIGPPLLAHRRIRIQLSRPHLYIL